MIERKYQLIKIDAGDWLLPGNDGKTLWRIAKYEDGPSYGLEDWPADKEFWGAWKWMAATPPRSEDDFSDWGRWDQYGYECTSRRDAIQAALKAELYKPKAKPACWATCLLSP